MRIQCAVVLAVILALGGAQRATAEPILVPTITYNYAFAYANVFGLEVGGNYDPVNGFDEGANIAAGAGFSVPGPDSNSAGVSAFAMADVPGYPDSRLTNGRVMYSFDTPQTDVMLFGRGNTSQQFTLEGLTAPVNGQIVVDYSSLFHPSLQVSSQDIYWSMFATIVLSQNGNTVASALVSDTTTGQLVYSGLLSPDDLISLDMRAEASVETLNGGTIAGNVDALVEISDWSIHVVAPDSTPVPDPSPQPVPEPGTLILLGSGLVGLVGYGRK